MDIKLFSWQFFFQKALFFLCLKLKNRHKILKKVILRPVID